jgi:BirA family biotin operon repressor/biotin-[acetyl-CoA-carboxylase] ligase
MGALSLTDWQRTGEFLEDSAVGYVINSTPETPSTQTLAKEAARSGAPHGSVFVTDFQTSGRGRRDRHWQSLPGRDLTFSMITRPDVATTHAPLLSLAAALAVSRALKKTAPQSSERISIKWPNDVLFGEKKVCGIICECAGAEKLDYAVLGIGVNVNRTIEELTSPDLSKPPASSGSPKGHEPTSLLAEAGRPFDLPKVLASVITELDRLQALVVTDNGRAWLLDEYRRDCRTIGRLVKIMTDSGDFEGVAIGVSDDGAIIIESVDGKKERKEFNAGDVLHARIV